MLRNTSSVILMVHLFKIHPLAVYGRSFVTNFDKGIIPLFMNHGYIVQGFFAE